MIMLICCNRTGIMRHCELLALTIGLARAVPRMHLLTHKLNRHEQSSKL